MKNKLIVLALLLSTSMLIAGGNIEPETTTTGDTPTLSSTAPISSGVLEAMETEEKNCKPERTYQERNVNLLWQDEAYTEDENTAFKNESSFGKSGDHQHAKNYCESLNYAGFSDWRLPTSEELHKVYDRKNAVFFYSTGTDFWTSTSSTEGRYYVVFPADAMVYARSPRQSNYIRCVRCTVK